MKKLEFSFNAMGSDCKVKCFVAASMDTSLISDEIKSLVINLENIYSRFKENSLISLINSNAGIARTPLDDEAFSIFSYASECYKQSKGLFDVTSGVLRRAWDFKNKIIPTQDTLNKLRQKIGWNKVSLSKEGIFLPDSDMEVDVGGIVKEYASDKVASYLKNNKIFNGFVNLGGDLHVIGPKPDGSPWSIGITHPRKVGESIAYVNIARGALASSGDYERYFEADGKRFCHILNPKTGLPVNDLQSVSVCADSCLVAGSLSTIAMLLGEVRGIEMLTRSRFPYLFVNRNGEVKYQGEFSLV